MKWAIPTRGEIEVPSSPSHHDPAYAADFNFDLLEQERGGICVMPTRQVSINEADLDIQAGCVHSFDSVGEMLDSLEDSEQS